MQTLSYYSQVLKTKRQMTDVYGQGWASIAPEMIIDLLMQINPLYRSTSTRQVDGDKLNASIALRENELQAFPAFADDGYMSAGQLEYATRSASLSHIKATYIEDVTSPHDKEAFSFLRTQSMLSIINAIDYELSRQYVYGNAKINPKEAMGLASILNGTGEFEEQIVDAGSTKTSGLTSVYVVTQGMNCNPFLTPPPSYGIIEDTSTVGNVTINMVSNHMERVGDTYRRYNHINYDLSFGFGFLMPELCCRICNIDVADVKTGAVDLNNLIFDALEKVRYNMKLTSGIGNITVYMNRELFSAYSRSFNIVVPPSGVDSGARFTGTDYRKNIDNAGIQNVLSKNKGVELMNFANSGADMYSMDSISRNESRVVLS